MDFLYREVIPLIIYIFVTDTKRIKELKKKKFLLPTNDKEQPDYVYMENL